LSITNLAGPLGANDRGSGHTVRGFLQASPIERISEEQVQQQFEVNLFGALRLIHEVLPGLSEQGAGTIVNVASVLGLVPFPFSGTYCAPSSVRSKPAIRRHATK